MLNLIYLLAYTIKYKIRINFFNNFIMNVYLYGKLRSRGRKKCGTHLLNLDIIVLKTAFRYYLSLVLMNITFRYDSSDYPSSFGKIIQKYFTSQLFDGFSIIMLGANRLSFKFQV